MKTLLWKELRENVKWALLAMVAFGAAAGYSVYQSASDQNIYGSDGVTIVSKGFLMVTSFGAPIVAMVLGFLQTLPELKADRWAALMHRPVKKSTVFWAKTFSGVILYTAAVGLPFALLVWAVASPGNFRAPFVPSMVRPGLIDLLGGLMYYFAALTLAFQKRRSIFLLPLPLLAALHVSFFAIDTASFHLALWAILAMCTTLLLAAWGTAFSQEQFQGRPWLGKLAFLAIALYGVFGVGDLIIQGVKAWGPQANSQNYRWETTKSGTPVRLSYKNGKLDAVQLPDGSTPTDPKLQVNRVTADLNYANRLTSYVGDSHGWKPSAQRWWYRQPYTYVNSTLLLQYPEVVMWFYLPGERYYEGFQFVTKKQIKHLDASGFQSPEAPLQPFPEDVNSSSMNDVLAFSWGDNLKLAFLSTTRILDLTLPAPGPIYGMEATWSYLEGRAVYLLAVALDSGIVLYDDKGEYRGTLSYRHDIDRWGQLSVTINPTRDRIQVKYEPSAWIDRETRASMPTFVDTMDPQDKLLEAYELSPLPRNHNELSLTTQLQRKTKSLGFFVGQIAYDKIGALMGNEQLARADRGRWTSGLKTTLEIIYWSLGWSIALSILTLFWSRKAGMDTRKSLIWTAFTFIFGIPGFLAFRLVSDWPTLALCPTCGKPRPVNLASCPACAGGWIAPARDGFEIMDRPLVTQN